MFLISVSLNQLKWFIISVFALFLGGTMSEQIKTQKSLEIGLSVARHLVQNQLLATDRTFLFGALRGDAGD